jgi:hypothetical protein
MALSKKVQEWIERGKEIKSEIKILEKELDDMKKKIQASGEVKKGVSAAYIGKNGSVLLVTTKEMYDPPSPETILIELRKRRMGSRFPECVKVLVEKTREILGEDIYNQIRIKKENSDAFSFK